MAVALGASRGPKTDASLRYLPGSSPERASRSRLEAPSPNSLAGRCVRAELEVITTDSKVKPPGKNPAGRLVRAGLFSMILPENGFHNRRKTKT